MREMTGRDLGLHPIHTSAWLAGPGERVKEQIWIQPMSFRERHLRDACALVFSADQYLHRTVNTWWEARSRFLLKYVDAFGSQPDREAK